MEDKKEQEKRDPVRLGPISAAAAAFLEPGKKRELKLCFFSSEKSFSVIFMAVL